MKRFDKTKSVEQGYLPIYANNMFTNVNIEHTVNNMKNLQGFCSCNSLPSGGIAKLQGGYYVLSNLNTWDFIGSSLNSLSFKQVYDKLKSL